MSLKRIRKEIVLGAIGIVLLAFFFGLFLGVILIVADVVGISEGSYLSKESILFVIYLNLIAMICGAIGGYLTGRYIHRALTSSSSNRAI